MAKPDAVFIYIGTYPSEVAARADYDVVKDLHAVGAVGSYDAAVVTKDDNGKVHENKDEMATRHGGWGGAAVGALIGLLFPPAIIASAAVGAAVGGVSGHLWRGMSRADVKELGELIDDGQAALVIVGESSGSLQEMLGHVADLYDAEMDTRLAALAAVIEPIIMIGMGLMVATIVIIMYLPIFHLSAVVR